MSYIYFHFIAIYSIFFVLMVRSTGNRSRYSMTRLKYCMSHGVRLPMFERFVVLALDGAEGWYVELVYGATLRIPLNDHTFFFLF